LRLRKGFGETGLKGNEMTSYKCEKCKDNLWVCEDHPDRPWESGTEYDCNCGAAGKPCICNEQVKMMPGSVPLNIWNN